MLYMHLCNQLSLRYVFVTLDLVLLTVLQSGQQQTCFLSLSVPSSNLYIVGTQVTSVLISHRAVICCVLSKSLATSCNVECF